MLQMFMCRLLLHLRQAHSTPTRVTGLIPSVSEATSTVLFGRIDVVGSLGGSDLSDDDTEELREDVMGGQVSQDQRNE